MNRFDKPKIEFPEQTPERIKFAMELLVVKLNADRAMAAYNDMKRSCQHAIIPAHQDEHAWWWNTYSEEWTLCTSAKCCMCNEIFGWYCLKSPTKICEYERRSENCIHCHEPDERK